MKGVEFENFWRWWEMMGGDERLEAFGGVNGGRAGGLGVKEYSYRDLGSGEVPGGRIKVIRTLE